MPSHRAFTAFLLLSLCSASAFAAPPTKSLRVLFVGNSLTYVGNLPAVFAGLCEASHHTCAVDMIVKGGASLQDRVEDRSLERQDVAGHFDVVVLQERGGELIGLPDEAARIRAEEAAATLVKSARQMG